MCHTANTRVRRALGSPGCVIAPLSGGSTGSPTLRDLTMRAINRCAEEMYRILVDARPATYISSIDAKRSVDVVNEPAATLRPILHCPVSCRRVQARKGWV